MHELALLISPDPVEIKGNVRRPSSFGHPAQTHFGFTGNVHRSSQQRDVTGRERTAGRWSVIRRCRFVDRGATE